MTSVFRLGDNGDVFDRNMEIAGRVLSVKVVIKTKDDVARSGTDSK